MFGQHVPGRTLTEARSHEWGDAAGGKLKALVDGLQCAAGLLGDHMHQ